MKKTAYRFSILVKRPSYKYSDEELSLMSEKERRYLKKIGDEGLMGSSYVQLEDAKGKVRTFALTPGEHNNCLRIMEISAPALGVLAHTIAPNSIVGKIGLGISGGVAAAGIPGHIAEHTKMNAYDDRLDYVITKEKYDSILEELTDKRTKYFNFLFHNCSGFAVDIARRNNLSAPPCVLMTPHRLTNYIQRLSDEYEKKQNEFTEADEKIESLFSDQEKVPKPERQKGTPVTLMDRLKSDKGLGLG